MRCFCSAFEITLFSRQNAPILTSTFFFSYYHLSFQCLTECKWLSGWVRIPFCDWLGALGISSGNRQRWHRTCQRGATGTRMWLCAGCRNRYNVDWNSSAPYRLHEVSVSAGHPLHPVKAVARHLKIRKMYCQELRRILSEWKHLLFQTQNKYPSQSSTPFIINWYNKERQKTASLLNILNGCEI